MRKELAPDCQNCEARPAGELAGERYKRLEQAAAALGFTVSEGSVVCGGRVPGSLLFDMDSRCGARLTAPGLASSEERERISKLEKFDEQAKNVLPETRTMVESLKASCG